MGPLLVGGARKENMTLNAAGKRIFRAHLNDLPAPI
jgi:hypothetical protein